MISIFCEHCHMYWPAPHDHRDYVLTDDKEIEEQNKVNEVTDDMFSGEIVEEE